MVNTALQDCFKGKGIAVIVPKGNAVDELLRKIPEERLDDVVYINPAAGSAAINVLEPHITPGMSEAQKTRQKEIIVSDLIDLFRRQSENWGDRFGRILETLLHAHIEANIRNSESKTLLDVFESITDSEKLIALIDGTRDVVVREQLVRVHEDLSSYELEPLQRRLNDFLINPTLRRFVSQKSSFNVREAVNQGKIILVDIQKGELGDKVTQLIGSIVITQIWAATQSRITQPPNRRTPFYLYIDELQNFGGEDGNFVKILSEAREYRLGCWLITQYLDQLPREMQKAVSTNCRTKIVFNPDGSNKAHLSKWLNGINTKELNRLGRFRAAIQTPAEGRSERAAVFTTTLPPWKPREDRDLGKIKKRATPEGTPIEELSLISIGQGNNAGGKHHRELLTEAKARLEDSECDVEILYQYSGADRPDAIVKLPSGEIAHLEAEHSTLSKPSKVLENLRRGQKKGKEVIFAVQTGNKDKLANILEDPVNRNGDDHQDENGSYSHYTDSNGHLVTDVQNLKNADYRIIEIDVKYDKPECPELEHHSSNDLQNFCLYRSDKHCTKLQINCVLTQ
ncbi:hypothetical protein C454_11151 [Haloferax gibbonsii ATCC 33959]|uniref:TraD/TraG TraM recognition site domain-containing protein n=2 Tax=Haloferax gibbonsii TaxID=35746 RepID=M0HAL3_HALGM|nr:hypothetical protein C454_11151 [Haloferax gibbonsii ATCC 33959]